MAKASVTLKCTLCGVSYTVEKKCYNRKDADNWESYMADRNGLCRECYAEEMRVQREAQRAAEIIKAQEASQKCPIQLPELVGSEKQIAWANTIRGKLIAKLEDHKIKWDVVTSQELPDNLKAEVVKLLDPNAKTWIESRGKTILGIYVEE